MYYTIQSLHAAELACLSALIYILELRLVNWAVLTMQNNKLGN